MARAVWLASRWRARAFKYECNLSKALAGQHVARHRCLAASARKCFHMHQPLLKSRSAPPCVAEHGRFAMRWPSSAFQIPPNIFDSHRMPVHGKTPLTCNELAGAQALSSASTIVQHLWCASACHSAAASQCAGAQVPSNSLKRIRSPPAPTHGRAPLPCHGHSCNLHGAVLVRGLSKTYIRI